MTEQTPWFNSLLDALETSGEDGCAAASFMRTRKTRIGFLKAGRHVGAIWTPWKSIELNKVHFTSTTPLMDPGLLTMVIHEVRHLQQGMLTALSIYGELDAWQLQFREYHRLTRKPMLPVIAEMLSLPLNWDRAVLKRARELMQLYAGKAYRADLLPLYPMHQEILYHLTGRKPK